MTSLVPLLQELLDYSVILGLQLLLILAVRKPLARYFGAGNAYLLWLLPLVWLPFYWVQVPDSAWDRLVTLFGMNSNAEGAVRGIVSWFPLGIPSLDLEPWLPAFTDFASGIGLSPSLWQILAASWLLVAGVLAVLQVHRVLGFSAGLHKLLQAVSPAEEQAIRAENGIAPGLRLACLPGLGSPALFGVVRPVLLLPPDFRQGFSLEQRQLMLAHELVHFRRRDNLANLSFTLARIVFWFNPLVQLAWPYYRLDQEMSCDELALGTAPGKRSLVYAKTLLASAGGLLTTRHQPTFSAWGNLREIRERTGMIKHHAAHKPSQGLGKALLCLLVLLGSYHTANVNLVLAQAVPAATAAGDSPAAAGSTSLSPAFAGKIQQVIALRDAEEYAAARAILEELQPGVESGTLNSREIHTLWLFQASLAQAQEDYPAALENYRRILALQDIGAQERNQAVQMAGSLSYMLEQYQEAIGHFREFLSSLEGMEQSRTMDAVKSSINLRIALAYNQLDDRAAALPYAEAAVALNEQDRSSHQFLRQLHINMGNNDAALTVARTMAERFDNADDATYLAVLENARATGGELPAELRATQSGYLPIYTVQPKYPRSAIDAKQEGWVQVRFDVDQQGGVVNAEVVDASIPEVFDQASLDAIAGFRFEPRVEAGTAVVTEGVQYVFRYNLTAD